MKRFLSIAILLLAIRASAVPQGDVIGASTINGAGQLFYNTHAMIALTFKGMGTNGVYDTGWNYGVTNNVAISTLDLTKAKIVVSLTSQGFAADGSATTYPRTIYGTKVGRWPYPNQATNNEYQNANGDLVAAFWLSDFIYSNDTAITVTVSKGVVVQGGVTNNSVSGLTVTNVSNAPYPNTVANWTFPASDVAHTVWTNRYIGYAKYGMNFRPVAYAYDTSQDAHGRIVTNHPTLTLNRNSAGNPIIDYESVCYATNFTQGDIITNHFYLYPWIGRMISSTNVTVQLLNATFTNHNILCDRSNLLHTAAVISPTGNDATGVATNNLAVARANPFKTVPYALAGLSHTNNLLFGRNNASASTIYCAAGTYNLMAAPVAGYTHTGDDSWVTITPDVGVAQSQVVFTNDGTLTTAFDAAYVKYQGVTLAQTNDYVMFYGSPNLWLDGCIILGMTNAAGGLGFFYQTPDVVLTGNSVHNDNGSTTFWGGNFTAGNIFYGFDSGGGLITLGNIFNVGSVGLDVLRFLPDDWIGAGNTFFGVKQSGISYDGGSYSSHGAALVQNVIEWVGGSAQPVIALSTTTQAGGTTNFLMMKNTWLGNRANLVYYNNLATPTLWDNGISLKDNLGAGMANKSDTFVGPAYGIQYGTNCFGNWEFVNGVGFSGNYISSYAIASTFSLEFLGVSSMEGVRTQYDETIGYRANASASGTGLGNGDYRLWSTNSPVQTVRSTWNGLPWDIAGNVRGAADFPGAYSVANPKVSGMFLAGLPRPSGRPAITNLPPPGSAGQWYYTVGLETADSSASGNSAIQRAVQLTLPAGTCSKLEIWTTNFVSSMNYKLALYPGAPNGPGSLLASGEITVTGNGWQALTLSAPVTTTSGTYSIFFSQSDTTMSWVYNSTTGLSWVSVGGTYADPPSQLNFGSNDGGTIVLGAFVTP